MGMDELKRLLDRNAEWANRSVTADTDFFNRLARQQRPDYLWIGCSDSRVPANQLVDMPPGELFVHRNVANVVAHSDLNCQSVIQFAIDHLKVKHVMVVGHYGCGGVGAALDRQPTHGICDYWLGHVRDVVSRHRELLEAQDSVHERQSLLSELNVLEQAINVMTCATVQQAWERGQDLSVHGWVYGVEDGRLQDLEVSVQGPVNVAELRAHSVEMICARRKARPATG